MSTTAPQLLSRRQLLLQAAAFTTVAALPLAASADEAIRPFKAHVPQAALVDLKRRLAAARWPGAETVADRSQGVRLATLQPLVHHWQAGYDWRRAESRLNALPQFVTRVDGVDIHFIHVRSRHPEALPLVMTHGWPGSVMELLDTIAPLTDPTAHGGKADEAFHLVLPSLPGFGFSGQPTEPGWGPDRIARAWNELMRRLGYSRYAAQGGDWGAIVSEALARQAPAGLVGIHVNRLERATTLPPDVARALRSGDPAPADLTAEQKAVFAEARDFLNKGFGYAALMATRPQTLAYGLADSPVGLAAWLLDKIDDWVFTRGDALSAIGRDRLLDDLSLYWFTNTGASSSRIYWDNAAAGPVSTVPITVPVAVTIFPGEVYRPPREWAERAYRQLVYYQRVDKGGHFAAWEEPQLFSEELRRALSAMR